MTGPTLEEMREYWGHQRTLRRCDGCGRRSTCWEIEGVSYSPEVVLGTCPYREVREAVRRMQEMTEGKPPGYYAITGVWFECQDLIDPLG